MYWDDQYNRLTPNVGPEHFKTYSASAPVKTHWRRATCEEIECRAFKYGFVMTIDFATELGQKQLYYLTKLDKDRRYSMQRTGPYEIKLIYGPGNPCMNRAKHFAPLEREPFYLVSGGDWRGNPRGVRQVRLSVGNWIDDFGEHQESLVERLKRG